MANQNDITLYPGDASPNDVVLRALPVVEIATTTIYLVAGDSNPNDIVLRDPNQQIGTPTHVATGSLVGQLGFITGTAVHFMVHVASGALVGQLGGVSGSASTPGGERSRVKVRMKRYQHNIMGSL